MISYVITGLKNTISRLKGFGKAFDGELGKAMWEVVLQIERDSKINCPVDKGDLRRSIKGVVKAMMAGKISGEVSATTDYAAYVHEGTSKMAARPFIMDAVRKNKKFIIDRLGAQAFKNVEKIIGR